jgi:eukaryotic-like serine/threonine-protein kinase
MWGMETVRTTLAGRYRLAEVIGRGGMSTVYRATDAVLGRTVAVKVLSAALAEDDPVWVTRFQREARAAASLTHPGVATVYDTGVEDGMRFIVMEFVRGRSLATILTEEPPVELDRAVEIGAQVADVLSAAHAAGIVHRDVKPGNIMVRPDGKVKVLDFGIARAGDSTALTQTISVLGTAAYMAPEQASGQPADARSDIYSLGCVLYAMLSGSPPFAGDLAAAVLHQHLHVPPRPLREVAPRVPAPVEGLVNQMLAKSPDARPRTAREVRDRLRAAPDPTAPTAVAGAAIPAGAAGARARPPRGVGARTRPPRGRPAAVPTARTQRLAPPPGARAGRGLALAAVALLALVIAAVAIASLGGSGGHKPRRTGHAVRRPRTTSKASSSTTTTLPQSISTTTTAPATAPPPPPPRKAKPPGHGEAPPGQAKKHGPGDGGGNGGDGGD